ncbi:MAG: inositol monophosphatase family protein [Syntrophobacteraceae bacterium]|nr:inositol monophosphatase family protein [Syntrophobacteraceae bacterium]
MNLDYICTLLAEAGRAVLDVGEGVEGELVSLDLASDRAERIISEGLRSCCGDIPLFSRVNDQAPCSVRVDLPRFWLVDPLDGAGEGKKGDSEFTVNIALIEGDAPVLGAVYVPVRGTLYFAAKGEGSWKIQNSARQRLTVSSPAAGASTRVVVNRSHISPDTLLLIDLLPSSVTVARDSALKFCAIAEGEADFYPRLDATREWETAAGQIIVTEAGGVTIDLDGQPFTYNKAGFMNGPFLVAPSLGWLEERDLLDCRKRLADWEFEYCAISCR